LSVHPCGPSRSRLSPFGKTARSLDRSHLYGSDNRCRRRSIFAPGAQVGSLAAARVASRTRCRERISLGVGIFSACRAVDGSRLFLALVASFQIFSARAIRVRRSNGSPGAHSDHLFAGMIPSCEKPSYYGGIWLVGFGRNATTVYSGRGSRHCYEIKWIPYNTTRE